MHQSPSFSIGGYWFSFDELTKANLFSHLGKGQLRRTLAKCLQ